MYNVKGSRVLVALTVLTLVTVSASLTIGKEECKVMEVNYLYRHKDNSIDCKENIRVNACKGLCKTGYSAITGRYCSACQPTKITLKKKKIQCSDRDVKKTVYIASAVGCKCLPVSGIREDTSKWKG